ncbi:MAG: ribonuclease P protein component [Clostridia bacterium]|nr:ribonuclease P protein component [Clostridia bacterium]
MNSPEVLRKQEDFNILYKRGKSSGSRHVVLLYRKNGLSFNRRAFLASKKVGNSVCRNRARRLMREAFRKVEDRLPQGYDLLLIARHTITETDAKCVNVERSLNNALERAGLLKK